MIFAASYFVVLRIGGFFAASYFVILRVSIGCLKRVCPASSHRGCMYRIDYLYTRSINAEIYSSARCGLPEEPVKGMYCLVKY